MDRGVLPMDERILWFNKRALLVLQKVRQYYEWADKFCEYYEWDNEFLDSPR